MRYQLSDLFYQLPQFSSLTGKFGHISGGIGGNLADQIIRVRTAIEGPIVAIQLWEQE